MNEADTSETTDTNPKAWRERLRQTVEEHAQHDVKVYDQGHYVPQRGRVHIDGDQFKGVNATACPAVHVQPPALATQVGGDHYKQFVIQPVEFCQRNNLGHCESNIVKYACRHKLKGGASDLRKIIHYASILLELEYPNEGAEDST